MKPQTKKLLRTIATVLLVVAFIFIYWKFFNTQNTDGPEPTDYIASPTPTAKTEPVKKPTPTVTEAPTPTEAVEPDQTPTPTLCPGKPTPTPTVKPTATPRPTATPKPTEAPAIDKNGSYYSKDEVALYIHTYDKLPGNYITKGEAEALGWTGGSVERYKKGAAIGGTYFGNYEKKLPAKQGRKYYECDIDTKGKNSRGAKRIIYSNDGLIYYTDDHYETFTLLYGEE